MPRRDAVLLLAVVSLALALRAWRVDSPRTYTGDEHYHVPAAKAYLAGGQTEDTTWSQPPLAPLLLGATIAVVGDHAWGWRLRSVVLGALTVLAVALLGRELYPDRPRTAWIAALLLAIDPLHVLLSRATLEEIQAASFFAFAAWLVVRHLRTGRPGLVAAGVLLGCAHASKAYYHLAGLVLVATVLAGLWRRRAPAVEYAHALLSLVAVPAAVYVATYLPWFGRGYGLGEFVEWQRASLGDLAGKTVDTFLNGPLLASGGTPASWFLKPAMFGMLLPAREGELRTILFAKNPVAWFAVLPAAALLAARARRASERGGVLLLGLLAATYVPLLALDRPIFLYSAVAVLPLGFLAVGRALDADAPLARKAAAAAVAVAVAAGAVLYPLVTGTRVPESLYLPVVSRAVLSEPR